MKKKQALHGGVGGSGDEHVEIAKAVAQAWHGHSSGSKGAIATTNEFDAYRRNFKSRPTRFKLEAMKEQAAAAAAAAAREDNNGFWDFRESLWDSYEIVAVSRKLETGLVLDDDPFSSSLDIAAAGRKNVGKKRKESKNSLRNLFSRMPLSSSRFTDSEHLPSDYL